MKAYQLKIVIKNSKPPIWRRCIVPAGITFSQLSIILNKIMGWSGYHLSEYEFYHLQLQLREDDEYHDFAPMWDFDLLDSSKTFINEYMEQQDWFTYTYDFGDDWQHRVTIEKIIEVSQNNYPQVIKYKGDCPMEDCGGIEGYYECIDVIRDNENPESNERREWAESQGYGEPYDMDEVNQDLQETCYIILGKGDKRKQKYICEDMFNNKFGLIASKTAKNKEQKVQSKRHQSDDMLKKTADMINQMATNNSFQNKIKKINAAHSEEQPTEDSIQSEVKKYIEDLLANSRKQRKIQLVDLLDSYSKEDLKDIAINYDISKVSSFRKDKLINCLKEKMLMPETVSDSFIVLRDDEIRAFERVAECETVFYIQEKEEGLIQNLINLGYIGVRINNQVDVPDDVIKVYNLVNTDEYRKLRKRVSWLVACFDMATWFYGAVPVNVMVKVFNQRNGLKTDYHSLMADFEKIPKSQRDFNLVGDLFVHTNLLKKDNYKYLMRNQGNKEYYIPTENEIKDIAENLFIMNDPNVEKLNHYFVKNLDIPKEEAKEAVRNIQHQINGGCEMGDVFDAINEMGICFNSQNDLNQILPILNTFWNNTRMLLNRGFKPNELFEAEKKHMRPFGPGNMPTIVPGSSTAAKLLMEGKDAIEKMGFPIDFDSNATEIPVYSMSSGINGSLEVQTKKIYPNDPCPCGSGKKYKKCCGK